MKVDLDFGEKITLRGTVDMRKYAVAPHCFNVANTRQIGTVEGVGGNTGQLYPST